MKRIIKLRTGAVLVAVLTSTMLVASTASADWWVAYQLSGTLRTFVPSPGPGLIQNSLVNTNGYPEWSNGNGTKGQTGSNTALYNENEVAAGSITYPEIAAATLNQIILHFYEDSDNSATPFASNTIGNGQIDVVKFDYEADLTNGIAVPLVGFVQFMWGMNDTQVTSGIGTLSGNEVVAWRNKSVGLVHNELLCKHSPEVSGVCGSLGLPPVDTVSVTHQQLLVTIDVANQFVGNGVPAEVPNSISMTFSNNFQDVEFDSTLVPKGSGGERQFFDLAGAQLWAVWRAGYEAPAMSDGQLVFLGVALVLIAIPVLMRRRARGTA